MSQYGYLSHHGIKGQRWGVKNGPPYPLGYEDHNRREKQANPKSSLNNYSEVKKKKAPLAYKIARKVGDPLYRPLKKKLWTIDQKITNIKTGRATAIRGGGRIKFIPTTIKKKDWTRDPVNKDQILKKGQSAYRIVNDKNEKISDKKMMYATINENDRNIFKGTFQNRLWNNKNRYEKEMKFEKDIKVASKDSQVNAIMKALNVNRNEALTLVGKVNYELVLDELKRSDMTKSYLDQIKKEGYDAVIDLNDSGWFGDQPVVLIDPEKYLSEYKIKRVTKKDANKAVDNMSWKFLFD